jgi:hypothetical protein
VFSLATRKESPHSHLEFSSVQLPYDGGTEFHFRRRRGSPSAQLLPMMRGPVVPAPGRYLRAGRNPTGARWRRRKAQLGHAQLLVELRKAAAGDAHIAGVQRLSEHRVVNGVSRGESIECRRQLFTGVECVVRPGPPFTIRPEQVGQGTANDGVGTRLTQLRLERLDKRHRHPGPYLDLLDKGSSTAPPCFKKQKSPCSQQEARACATTESGKRDLNPRPQPWQG